MARKSIITRPSMLPASAQGAPPLVWPTLPPQVVQNRKLWRGAQQMPVGIKFKNEPDYWYLPQEPMVSIGRQNALVKRTVAKAGSADQTVRGTVKELWGHSDYDINIVGVLYNIDDEMEYPRASVERLRNYCEAKEVLEVMCPLFEIFNITQMVIERYDIPHTKGENRQAFSIGAISDNDFSLLISQNQ